MNHCMARFRLVCRPSSLQMAVLCAVLLATSQVSAEQPPSFPLADVVKQQAATLTAVDSNAGAIAAFTASVGPAIGLRDVAGTIGAKAIPAKMAKELGVADLSLSVQRLMAALAAWHLGEAVMHQVESSSTLDLSSVVPTGAREAWLMANGPWAALPELLRLTRTAVQPESTEPTRETIKTDLALAANRLALEASQRATALWWDLQGWKDRVRNARGRARLCGTWHWVIHNHQNHGEQKTSMIFLPSGQERPGVPAPAEMVVLGDSVYLRWEMDGRVQEDSLLFIKDGSRLEGSFVNNAGGWGSITGKRTSACQP